MADRTVLWVGSAKGAYAFESDGDRRAWRLRDPVLPEWSFDSLLLDPEDPDHVLAGTSHAAWGATIRETRDGGKTWSQTALRAPDAPAEHKLQRIWQLFRNIADGTLLAGVEDAALYVSRDGGGSWSEVSGLTRHPSRPHWQPGGGGLCLHTILVDPSDPRRMWVGISAVGVFATTDGGETWEARNKGIPAMSTTGSPDEDAVFCIHKMALDPQNPDRLYMQFHAHTFTPDGQRSSGVFRSDDGAKSWQAIDQDLPLKFGFPLVHSSRGELFVMPLISDENRTFDQGRPTVWRSRNGGEGWDTLELPTEGPVYAGILRDAMTADGQEQTGVYAGTTNGELFASPDAGDTWHHLPARLPRVLCVRAQAYA